MMRINPLSKFSIIISFTTLLSQSLVAQTYCAAKGNNPWQQWMARVEFNGIDNVSAKEGYGNFSNQVAIVQRDSTYVMKLTQGFSWAADPANATQQGRVWIDYNQNGALEPTELAATFSRNLTIAQIQIPSSAKLGYMRMRIALKTSEIPTPCEIFDKGEVEDYTIQVVNFVDLPDLAIANLNLTNPTVAQGQVLKYKFDLSNIGRLPILGRFNVKGYISKDNVLSPDDIQDGIVPTGNFPAGFSVLQVPGASTIRPTIAAGQYYLILVADSDNQVLEANELNNRIVSLPFRVTPVVENSCRYQDSLQLVRLYQATNGANWANKWNLNTPINSWFGVALTAEGCVKSLELRNNNLVGTIPNLNLPKLDLLFMGVNALSGSIPAFNLPLLQGLELGSNQLTGSIPNFNLPNLKGLYLSRNQLTGPIPNFNCPQMSFIEITNNPLTGAIPNFNMPELNGIIITFTQVTGPLPNFNLPKLTLLHLNDNQLTGTIPNFNLPLLGNLFLHNNRFTGNIPAFNLPKANPILLDNNQLTGSIPNFNVPANCFIRLSSNQLSGCLPASLKKFCPFGVELFNNPGLATQDFADFCSTNAGMCSTTSTHYCASKGSLPWDHWMEQISLHGEAPGHNFPKTAKEGYGNFTSATPASLFRDKIALVTLTPKSSWARNPSNNNLFWSVWIDWNQDNDFEDVGEQMIQRNVTFYIDQFLDNYETFRVPATALLGKTRMRIAMKLGEHPLPCETFQKGEVEDYSVNITNASLPLAQPLVVTNPLNAMLYEQKVKLDWVQSADSVAHFEVQKLKTDGTGFETIHQAIAQDGDNYYMGYDDLPVEGENNYRLKTVLKNGKTGYSPIQKVDYQQLVSFTVFPNPASDETFLSLKDFVDKTIECRILDISGKALFHQTIEKANILPHRLNTASLKAGTYFIEIQCVGKRTVTRKLFIL